jgi:histidine triad (HIT) family protein
MDDCLFCGIVAGKIPSQEVAATERTYAFRDIQPAMPVHVLVIPREHIGNAADITAEHGPVLAEMITTAQSVAAAEGLAERGYRLVFNVGEDALISGPHINLHVLGGRRMGWPPG